MARWTKRIRSHTQLYEFLPPLPLRYTTSNSLCSHPNKMIGDSSRTANTSQERCPSIPRKLHYSVQHIHHSKGKATLPILPILLIKDRVFRPSKVIPAILVSRAIHRTMHLGIHNSILTGFIQATMAMPTLPMAGNPRHHPEMAIV